MSTIFTTTIPETDCIGDSLDTINNNFDNLGTAVATVSSTINAFNVIDSPTIDLTFNSTTRSLSGSIIAGAVTTESISNGAVTPIKLAQPLTLATAQNATGTSIDFTGIPSWVRRITIMFNGVSTSGTSHILIQVGSGGITSSGYNSCGGGFINGVAGALIALTTGYVVFNDTATDVRNGHITITTMGNNTYVSSHTLAGDSTRDVIWWGTGSVSLPGILDRLRITTASGTDTFDAGTVNIMYEG